MVKILLLFALLLPAQADDQNNGLNLYQQVLLNRHQFTQPEPVAPKAQSSQFPLVEQVKGNLPTIQLPATVQGDPGDFIEIIPIAVSGDDVSWFVLDKGLSLFPPGRLIDHTSAVVVSAKPGKYRVAAISVACVNGKGVGSSASICTVIIGDPGPEPGTPSITSPLTANGNVNAPFSYQIVATNSPTSYGASGLPSGLSLNTSTGLITGNPSSSGTSSVSLSAANASKTGTATLVITVADIPLDPFGQAIKAALVADKGTIGDARSMAQLYRLCAKMAMDPAIKTSKQLFDAHHNARVLLIGDALPQTRTFVGQQENLFGSAVVTLDDAKRQQFAAFYTKCAVAFDSIQRGK